METLKFLPNKPVELVIKYDQPKTGTSQYGEWYMYGCQVGGQDTTFFAPKGLQDRLQALGTLKGRLLKITKVVDIQDGREIVRWTIEENGQDITPDPQNSQNNITNVRVDESFPAKRVCDICGKAY